MKKYFIILMFFNSLMFSTSLTKGESMLDKIHWFGQASVLINTGKVKIYIDPVSIKKEDKADIILVTHDHDDHFSINDINKLTKDGTVLISSFKIKNSIAKGTVLSPGKTVSIGDVKIETVPSYNIKKTKFHPKSKNFVGYIVTTDGVRIYHAGDTERIPEMKTFSCDIALIPLGQTYTMNTVDEAVLSVLDVKASIAIPIHFGMYEGTNQDADKFISDLTKKGIKAVILEREK